MEKKIIFKGKFKWDLNWTDVIIFFIILMLWLQAREYRQAYIDCNGNRLKWNVPFNTIPADSDRINISGVLLNNYSLTSIKYGD